MADMKERRNQLEIALKAARDLCELADSESREFTADERQKVQGYLTEAKTHKDAIKAAEGDQAMRDAINALGAGMDPAPDRQQAGRGAAAGGRGKTLGQQFVEAAAYQAWLKAVAPNGRIPESAKGLMSPAIEFKTLLTGADDESAGAFVQTDYTGIYEPLGRRPLVVRDLISQRPTGSDIVEFVRQVTGVSAAAPTAEATATSGSSGTKPEGSMTFEQVTATVKTIPVWIPATKRALSDVGQLRGLIDQELRADMDEEMEDQILTGDGTGDNFTGIMETDGILAQAWDTDLFTTTRKAITAVRVTGRQRPTAWLVNPADAETIDLLKDEAGRFYYGGPATIGQRQLWGYPVVECEGMPEGYGMVGNWAKAVLWNREQASIQVSDSHADFFVRNMVAILAEERAAFGVIRPSAFCMVELTSGS